MLLFAASALHWSRRLDCLALRLHGQKRDQLLSDEKSISAEPDSQSVFLQKLDTNAGVAYRMIQQAHRQDYHEMIVAYYAIVTSDEPIELDACVDDASECYARRSMKVISESNEHSSG